MRKKMIFWIVGVLLVSLFLSWVIPVKISMKSQELKEYSEGSVVLVCTVDTITGPFWKVENFYGTENAPEHVDIIGNIPENSLKRPLYTYYHTEFVFIGNFSSDNPEVFEAVRWEVVGKITRNSYIIPISPYYFNIWEIKINN